MEKYKEFKKIPLTPYFWIVIRNELPIGFVIRGLNSIHHVYDTDFTQVMNNLPSMLSAYNSFIKAVSEQNL